MFGGFFASLAGKIISGAVIAILLGGGIWYAKSVYDGHILMKQEVAQLKQDNAKLTETMKNDLKTDASTESRKEAIDRMPPEQLINEWNRLRQYKGPAGEDSPSE